ncbi:sugar phosphate isomerase/epimerase family protein [Allorhizobium undicola]|uniref:sugar phosphate isomerase/epimerase family protein n=1 Tax=Allorhizobium undicola TaxID=78527 RepID=UPI003D32D4D2
MSQHHPITHHPITLGTTLYSFTNEFHARQASLEDLIRETDRRGLGPALEVVGFQSFRSFPDVSDAEADRFKAVLAETSLYANCLGINADRFMHPGTPISDDEMVEFHLRQIAAAAKLGFKCVRYQNTATPGVIRRCVDLAEKLGVKLGLEIHAPHSANHPDIVKYRTMYDEVGSDLLGFIPDFGATAHAVPDLHLNYFRNVVGAPETAIQKALEIWHDDAIEPFQRFGALMQWAGKNGVEDRHAVELMIIYGIINRMEPESWAEIMPQCFHIHGKFYDVDPATGKEAAIDYDRTMKVFLDNGFSGTISGEWEGHMVDDGSGFARVEAWHAMMRNILGAGA